MYSCSGSHHIRGGKEKSICHLVRQIVKAVLQKKWREEDHKGCSTTSPLRTSSLPVLLWVVIYCPLEVKSGSASEEEGHMFRKSMIKYFDDSLITSFTSDDCKMLFLGHRWDIWDVHSAGDVPLNVDEYLIFIQICSCFQPAVMTARFHWCCVFIIIGACVETWQ